MTDCAYCKDGKLVFPTFTLSCTDCDGTGKVCHLCRESVTSCECGGSKQYWEEFIK